MEDKRITADEILAEIDIDVKQVAQKVADAINNAQAGAIINQSEEQVRDAHAVFRQATYQKALSLLGKTSRLFPPRQKYPKIKWSNKGKQKTSCLTVNGRMEFTRTVFWNKGHGTVIPMDGLLGIESSNYSHGVCEICCRENLNSAFVPASDNIKRLAQLNISSSTVRQLVEQQGRTLINAQRRGKAGPDFTSKDCTNNTIIIGSDGVMVPMVTEDQKRKRRQTEAKKRIQENRQSTARAARPRKGSDGPYKEFKLVAIYDEDKRHQYVAGTSGDHEVAGRMMRQIGRQANLSQAKIKYSVSDGAVWILKQLNIQLPMLDDNVLDFYHLRDHVTKASHALFGEGSQEAVSWKAKMMEAAKNQGSLVMLDRLGEYLTDAPDDCGQTELHELRDYIAKRVAMTDYPSFIQQGYDIGSGPTESFCGCLTKRLKGAGMRWDKDNAEAVMALASLYSSHLWNKYWDINNVAA
jgi:hypothetical protein